MEPPRAPGLLDAVAQLCPPTKPNRCRGAVNTQLGVSMCLLTDSWIARKWGAVLGQCPHLGHLLLPALPHPCSLGPGQKHTSYPQFVDLMKGGEGRLWP